ncbi:MAG: sugar phosphate nucleotidyltransferase [Nitrospirota bacterium]
MKKLDKARSVQFAIIPAAGKGTRLLPVTSVVPKELISVGNKPMIHYAMERIIDARIPKVVVVLSPLKKSLKRYLRQEFSEKTKLNFVIQKEPTGLADAIALCRPVIGKKPFLLCMPDGLHWGDSDFLRRLLDLFNKTGKTSLGIYLVTPDKAYLYGNCGRIKGDFTSGGYLEIESLGDKRPGSFEVKDGIAAYRGIGVSACTEEFFDYIEKYRSIYKGGELDDVPVFQMILKEKGIVGEIFRGDYFDIGNQQGLMYTQHFLWEKTQEGREEIQTPFEMTVLGSGTAVPHRNRLGPGYLLRINDRYLLFDPSAGTLHRAVKCGINLEKISHVFFTHLHPDHTGDLVPILFALKNSDIDPTIYLQIIGPPGFRDFFNHLKVIYGHWIDVPPEKAKISEIPSGGLSNQEWSIRWKPVVHTENSIGYRVTHEGNGKIWAYSGDTDYCEGITKLVYDADVAVLECSFPDQLKEIGHLTPSLAGRIASEGKVRHLVLSHFYPKCDGEDIIAQCRKEYSGRITLATDYLRIQI